MRSARRASFRFACWRVSIYVLRLISGSILLIRPLAQISCFFIIVLCKHQEGRRHAGDDWSGLFVGVTSLRKPLEVSSCIDSQTTPIDQIRLVAFVGRFNCLRQVNASPSVDELLIYSSLHLLKGCDGEVLTPPFLMFMKTMFLFAFNLLLRSGAFRADAHICANIIFYVACVFLSDFRATSALCQEKSLNHEALSD